MKKEKLIFIIGLYISFISKGQDVHFTQFYNTPLLQNPAMAGNTFDVRAGINYRNQWASVGSPFSTFMASFDTKIRNQKNRRSKNTFGVGAHIYSDKSGDLKMGTTYGSFSLAYQMALSDKQSVSVGLQGGFTQRRITNFAGATTGNQYNGASYDPSLSLGESNFLSSYSKVEAGAGIVWNYSNQRGRFKVVNNKAASVKIGLSAFHLNRPDYSFINTTSGNADKLYMKYVFHGSSIIPIESSKIAILPKLLYTRQGKSQEILVGALVRSILKPTSKYTGFISGSSVYFGALIRPKDAMAIITMLEVNSFMFGLSYDINLSKLNTATNGRGGIEFSLRYVLPNAYGNNIGRSRYD